MLATRRVERDLSILLCGDREMARLHEQYLGEPGSTDVLAFPQRRGALGDVVLCIPFLARRARAQSRPARALVQRMLAHGILHLLGFDHSGPAEERRMEAAARRLLRLPGVEKKSMTK